MDPVVFNNIKSFLSDGTIPPGLTKVQQNNFRPKTKNYELQGELDCLKWNRLSGFFGSLFYLVFFLFLFLDSFT